MTRLIYRSLDILILETSDWAIAAGFVLGLHLGLIPVFTLQWVLAFALLILFRINFLSVLISWGMFFTMGEILEGAFHHLGLKILTGYPSLYSLWGWMNHVPIVPFTRFNNTVVLGSTFIAYLLSLPLFLVCFKFLTVIRKLVSNLWYTTKMSRSYAHYARARRRNAEL